MLFLLRFNPLPLHLDFIGVIGGCTREDVRVSANQLRVEVCGYIFNREVPGFCCKLRVEQYLQQQISEFIFEVGP